MSDPKTRSAEKDQWQDTPEKEAWRALIPACADAISGFYTPGETVGDLAQVLAVRVLSVAFQHRETLVGLADEAGGDN